jgi:phosphoglycolate phosphatase-like HAD superfamily hydrolase
MFGDAVQQRGRPRQCLADDDEFAQATLRDLRRVGATSGYALARGWILARHLAVLELQPADVLLVGDSVDDADAAADTARRACSTTAVTTTAARSTRSASRSSGAW